MKLLKLTLAGDRPVGGKRIYFDERSVFPFHEDWDGAGSACGEDRWNVSESPEEIAAMLAEEPPKSALEAAAPDLLAACKLFDEWLKREENGFKGKRDTPEGEAEWREWYNGNLNLCRDATDAARAAIAKAEGR